MARSLLSLLLSVTVLIFFSACSGGGTNGSQDTAGEESFEEDTSAGLKGVDANGDGIRDDVNTYIDTNFSHSAQEKSAAEQYAKSIQLLMEASSKEEALAAGDATGKSVACVHRVLNGKESFDQSQRLINEIRALTTNTRERFSAYLNANKLGSGGYFPGYDKNSNPCE